MKNLKFFVIIFLDELGLLLSILGFFKDFLEISLISLISANLPLPKNVLFRCLLFFLFLFFGGGRPQKIGFIFGCMTSITQFIYHLSSGLIFSLVLLFFAFSDSDNLGHNHLVHRRQISISRISILST